MSETLWDASDVAKFLKCSRSYVYKAAEAGMLPCLRIGAMLRFDPERVKAFALGMKAEGGLLQLSPEDA